MSRCARSPLLVNSFKEALIIRFLAEQKKLGNFLYNSGFLLTGAGVETLNQEWGSSK